jgi:ABC-2 type transport system ATP-binding protein
VWETHGMSPLRPFLAALVAAGALALPATAAADDATVTSFDGTTLVVHFVPAVGLQPGERAPTVLQGPGWSQPGTTDENAGDSAETGATGVGTLRGAGYNVVTWDPRGFGRSGGTVQVDSPAYEGRDVQAILDWLATRPEAKLDAPGDPRVGMVGASYGGGIQLVTAGIDRRVDVLVPVIAWHTLPSSLYRDNTVKLGWATILGTTGSLLGRLDPHVTSAIAQGVATGRLSQDTVDWFAARGPGDLVDRIRVPTLLIQGTVDDLFTLDEAVANYRILRGNRVPTKMVWFCGGHGACLTPAGDRTRPVRATLTWLSRYLDGRRDVATGARFSWVDQDGRAREANDYPLPAATPITARGSGRLTLTDLGGSGPALPTSSTTGAISLLALPATPAKALNAVNVPIATGAAGRSIVGAPTVWLTYEGRATNGDARVYAQLVDDETGRVLGNQITPIPLTLDGARRTVTRPLETIAATTRAGSGVTLQLVASSTAYGPARALGSVTFSAIDVALPTVSTG